MISIPSSFKPNVDALIPYLDNGIYDFGSPIVEHDTIPNQGTLENVVRIKCCSLKHHQPNSLEKCNGTVLTFIGKQSGNSVMIAECGKCRTSYLIRTKANAEGNIAIYAYIWSLSHKLEQILKVKQNSNGQFFADFN